MMTKFTLFCFLAFSVPAALLADAASDTKSEIVLTVTGEIAAPDADVKEVTYDLNALAALGSTTIETTTIWTEGLQTFEGVELATLLETLGVTEGVIKAIALNDYSVEIPVDVAVTGGPILAYKRNGELMPVRDKGPLWVIFPYDSSARYRTEVTYSQSIWQLAKLEITD